MTGARSLAVVVFAALVVANGWTIPVVVNADDAHGYFNSLIARPEHWKSFDLRSQAQIDQYSGGKKNQYVTYDSSIDAAKAVIPSFRYDYKLARPVEPTDDRIALVSLNKSLFVRARAIRIDNEIMLVEQPGGSNSRFPEANTVLVRRGAHGTARAAHSAGARAQLSANSLPNQVRVPLGTTDGHRYFITWDVRYTDSYLGTNLTSHKAYQLTDQQKSSIWLETRTRFNGADGKGNHSGFDRKRHVATIDVRSYNTNLPKTKGSNVRRVQPLQPQAGRFVVWPNRWVRFFWLIDQRAGLDLATLWVADEQTEPVKILDARTVSVRGNPSTIAAWYLELNTSQDRYRGKLEPLVSYVRNLAILQDVGDPSRLLQRPTAGPASAPGAPQNLRVIP